MKKTVIFRKDKLFPDIEYSSATENRTLGPSQEEINAHRGNIHDLQTNLTHKNELFTKHLPNLLLPMPNDKELTLQCQSGVEFKIKGEKSQQDSLTDKKRALIIKYLRLMQKIYYSNQCMKMQ